MNIDYNNEAVAAFSAQCDEFIGSKLIMSNQKIRMLLRCMAYYDELKKLAYDCRFNFDYDDEYTAPSSTSERRRFSVFPRL